MGRKRPFYRRAFYNPYLLSFLLALGKGACGNGFGFFTCAVIP
jgi:hypothetical protein